MNKLVSVVITTYNRKSLLLETLSSVRLQSWRPVQIIVVDDGSDAVTFTESEAKENGVDYYYIPNSGQAAARNFGIKKSHGEYVAFVDDDDIWLVDKLEKQMKEIECGSRWVSCDCRYFDNETGMINGLHGKVHKAYSGDVFLRLLKNCFIASPTVLVERELLLQTGLFFEDRAARFGEDWFMWLRLAARSKLSYINEPLALYRIHGSSMLSNAGIDTIAASHEYGLSSVFDSLPNHFSRFRELAMLWDRMKIAKIAYGSGDLQGARKYAQKAFRESKFSFSALAILIAVHLPLRGFRKGAK